MKRRLPLVVGLLVLLFGGAFFALNLSTPPPLPEAADRVEVRVEDVSEAPRLDAGVQEAPPLSWAAVSRGSIKTVQCSPERAGETVLAETELLPPPEAARAMEGCLDMTADRFPEHHAIQLTIVYYLAPDGTVTQTGVGADVQTAEAWDLLEPCAREYWLAYPPRVSPSDEKSFSCVYRWSQASIGGGVGAVAGHVAKPWAGRDSAPIGQRMKAD